MTTETMNYIIRDARVRVRGDGSLSVKPSVAMISPDELREMVIKALGEREAQ